MFIVASPLVATGLPHAVGLSARTCTSERSRRGLPSRVIAKASRFDELADKENPTEIRTRVALSPLALNLDVSSPVVTAGDEAGSPGATISPAVVPSGAAEAARTRQAPPPPPTTPPPKSMRKNAIKAVAARTARMPGERRSEATEAEEKPKATHKPPTTFFSHDFYYNEPKRIDTSKYRTVAESAYGARGRRGMSRARDVAIAGSALRRSPSPENTIGNAVDRMREKKAKAAAVRAAAQKKKDDMYAHKRRVMRALEVEREELPDGAIMFRFSERPLTAKEEREMEEAEAKDAELELLHTHAEEYGANITFAANNLLSRWIMTVKFLASTLSLESAAFYVVTTPFRTGFWTMAYAVRLVWWLVSGRMLPGRAAKRASTIRAGGGNNQGAFAAIDARATKLEAKQAGAGKRGGSVAGRDMRNVLLSDETPNATGGAVTA